MFRRRHGMVAVRARGPFRAAAGVMAARTAAAGAVAMSAAPLTAPARAQCEPAWSDVGGGMSGLYVIALAELDDGSGAGPSLYASGAFDTAGGTPASKVARCVSRTLSRQGARRDAQRPRQQPDCTIGAILSGPAHPRGLEECAQSEEYPCCTDL